MRLSVAFLPLLLALAAADAAQAQAADVTELDEIVVTGDAFSETNGYLARQSSTASRFPVNVETLPNTIRILPAELIEDTRATLPQDITRYVSGVQTLPSFGSGTGYVVRGFFANYETLLNGVRTGDNPGDLVNVERIEIVKGPVGSLYGASGAFAGAVNVITRRPLDTFEGRLTAFAGSDDFYRLEGDVGGPLTAAGDLTYRLSAAVEDADSFRDNVTSRKWVVAPSIQAELGPRATLRVDSLWLDRRYTFEEGLPADPVTFTLPLGRTLFAPNASLTDERYAFVAPELTVRATDALTLRLAANVADYEIDIGSSRLGASLEADGRTLNRQTTEGPQESRRSTLQADAIYRSDRLFEETVFLVGYERNWSRYTYFAEGQTLPPIDILSGVNPPVAPGPRDFLFEGFSRYAGDALYGQVFSRVTDRLSVLAGYRYDWYENEGAFNGPASTIEVDRGSPRVGFSYRLSAGATLYGNWAENFIPNLGTDIDGEVFEPDQVRQFEVGLRKDLFDGRASATVALFDIERSNVIIPDIDAFNAYIAAGRQTSRGVELDVTGRLSDSVDVIATYTYNPTRVAERDDPNFDAQLPAAPEHSASAYVKHRWLEGSLAGLSATFGVTYADRIQTTLPSTVFIDASVRLDAGVAYERDGWRLGLNINNLTDERSYATNLYSLTPLPPRQLFVTLERRFGGS
jgi:iron complex outermembrane recepter protein